MKSPRDESQVADLLRMIGREPSRKITGTAVARKPVSYGQTSSVSREVPLRVGGIFNRSYTRALTALQSLGVANDIGLALGLSDIAEMTLNITNEEFVQHYRSQELVFELATISILYHSEI